MLDIHIAAMRKQPLVEHEAPLQFGLLSVNYEHICALNLNNKVNVTPKNVCAKCKDLFEDYGKLNGKLQLFVDPTVSPVRLPLRNLPMSIKARVEQEMKTCREGIRVPVNEPTQRISALLVVIKSQGGVRICADPKTAEQSFKARPLSHINH